MSHWLLLLVLGLSPLDKEVVIENPRVPTGQSFTLVFEEDLRFGADEDSDDYLWASVNIDLAVDSKGHIYIADPKTNDIREFDKTGKFVRKLAIAGAGPGELGAISKIQFLPDGRLAAFESKPMFQPRIQFFDKDGKYLETKSPIGMSTVPLSATLNPEGTYFTGGLMMIDPAAGSLVTKTGLTKVEGFEMVKEYSSFLRKVDFAQMGNPAVMADMIGGIIDGFYAGSGIFTFDAKGNLYAALSPTYEITKWNPSFDKKLMVVKRDYKPIAMTETEKRAVADQVGDNFKQGPFASMVTDEFILRMMEKVNFPLAKDPVEGLAIMEDGHLLVVHNYRADTGDQTVDIFNQEGKYLGQSTLGNFAFQGPDREFRMVFKNGFAYTVETDQDGDNRCVRYRVKLIKK